MGAWIQKMLLKFVGGLFLEQKNGEWIASKGNVAFWIVLTHCMYVWSHMTEGAAHDVSDGELYTLWALLGYAGIKIGADAFKSRTSPATPEVAPS